MSPKRKFLTAFVVILAFGLTINMIGKYRRGEFAQFGQPSTDVEYIRLDQAAGRVFVTTKKKYVLNRGNFAKYTAIPRADVAYKVYHDDIMTQDVHRKTCICDKCQKQREKQKKCPEKYTETVIEFTRFHFILEPNQGVENIEFDVFLFDYTYPTEWRELASMGFRIRPKESL